MNSDTLARLQPVIDYVKKFSMGIAVTDVVEYINQSHRWLVKDGLDARSAVIQPLISGGYLRLVSGKSVFDGSAVLA